MVVSEVVTSSSVSVTSQAQKLWRHGLWGLLSVAGLGAQLVCCSFCAELSCTLLVLSGRKFHSDSWAKGSCTAGWGWLGQHYRGGKGQTKLFFSFSFFREWFENIIVCWQLWYASAVHWLVMCRKQMSDGSHFVFYLNFKTEYTHLVDLHIHVSFWNTFCFTAFFVGNGRHFLALDCSWTSCVPCLSGVLLFFQCFHVFNFVLLSECKQKLLLGSHIKTQFSGNSPQIVWNGCFFSDDVDVKLTQLTLEEGFPLNCGRLPPVVVIQDTVHCLNGRILLFCTIKGVITTVLVFLFYF